jgi:hypothetical protein
MNYRKLSILVSLCGMAIGSHSTVLANAVSQLPYDQKTLAQVEALYGLSEDAAVSRLAKEYEAAVQAQRIEECQLPSYAGMWFN